ncbi:MAG TPA: NAD(P)H-binding protein [Gemmatimonadaceae bacterium]|nr:NAD(P)H-binding protein [Gemmatimonadaceae bacterium]
MPTSTAPLTRSVFLTGGTGYVGSRLIRALTARGHSVRALTRAASAGRLPTGCEPVIGDALDASTFARALRADDTFVQLVGTPHPSPAKAAEFERVDFVSVRESVRAARERGVAHFVYVSVAHPAPIMRAYIDVRVRGEGLIRDSGLPRTILRPWYVLGPGHRWPYVLVPLYAALSLIPSSRESARRLGLVSISQMVRALVTAVENPPLLERVMEVPDIRRAR